jgi:AraC-like DNA-binding protein
MTWSILYLVGLATQSRIIAPDVRLRPYVEAHWCRTAREDGRTMRVLPDASSYVLFDLAGEMAGSAYVVGMLLHPVLVPLRGDVDRVGIKLRPGAANLLFGTPARDVRNRVVQLGDVSARFRPSLLDELSAADDFRARVGVVERWLLGELDRLRPSTLAIHAETNRLLDAVDRGARPRDLRDLTGWNERKIQRIFHTRFGASAATIRRLSRFRRSLAVLEAGEHASRASASSHLGYSDQAHMCREFREFAGTDIGSLLAERRHVGNVQAAGQGAV